MMYGINSCRLFSSLRQLRNAQVNQCAAGIGTLAPHPAFRHLPAITAVKGNTFSPRRNICRSTALGHYEGDGKTTISILNSDIDSPLMIDAYHENGFQLNNGFWVRGPMAIFPKSVLAWDVGSAERITPGSLVLFMLLEPKIDVLIIGVGDQGKQLPKDTIKALQAKKINFEVLPTEHALSTFNFLTFERRCVAGAMLPPATIKYFSDDLLRNRMDKIRMYSDIPEVNKTTY